MDSVTRAVADIAAGRPVVLQDESCGGEGLLVVAAASATTSLMAYLIRHTSGYLTASLTDATCDRLNLPPMQAADTAQRCLPYTVSVDARERVTTGISAIDRAITVRLLADSSATASDFVRPGHVVAMRAREDGVLAQPGRAEACTDLARLGGLPPAAVSGEIVSVTAPANMACGSELQDFATAHGLGVVRTSQLVAYRRYTEHLVRRTVETRLPTAHGTFRSIGYTSHPDRHEHIALVAGQIGDGVDVPVGVYHECLRGHVFGAYTCNCHQYLQAGLDEIGGGRRGVVLYFRDDPTQLPQITTTDGHGFCVPSSDTLGRLDHLAAQTLRDLGVRSIRNLAANRETLTAYESYGIHIHEPVLKHRSVTAS
jgi:3,4-dihydroxy 2-butanone 4-phosphate synthase/GTP cyclohydrolase II